MHLRDSRWKFALVTLTPEMLVGLAKDAEKYVEAFDRLRQQAKDLMDDFGRDMQGYMPVYEDPRPEMQALREHFAEAATEVEEAWMAVDNTHHEIEDVQIELRKLLGVKTARSFSIPRELHVPPSVRDQKPLTPEGTDLAIWVYDEETVGGRHIFGAIAFAGKANKPLWHYTFRDDAARQRQIDETIENRKSLLDMKKKRQEERKQFKHNLTEGDILYTSWGYDQTNVEFYQVVEVRGAMVVVREVAKKTVSESTGSESVVGQPNQFVGPPLKRRPTGVFDSPVVKISESQRAYKWDGRPKHQTAWGYGH